MKVVGYIDGNIDLGSKGGCGVSLLTNNFLYISTF